MIRDLLNPSSGFLDLREDSKGVIQVAGITEVSTINAQEVRAARRPCTGSRCAVMKPPVCPLQIMELLMKGNKQRTQEPTAANQTSSRSHAVLQVAVRQQSRCRDVLQEVRFARLFMIDLAGSERAAQVCLAGTDGVGYLSVLREYTEVSSIHILLPDTAQNMLIHNECIKTHCSKCNWDQISAFITVTYVSSVPCTQCKHGEHILTLAAL